MKAKAGIVITGANGYIGAHGVNYFSNLNYDVLALVSLKNQEDKPGIRYLLYDEFFSANLSNYKCLLHCSWSGVTHAARQDEEIQKSNFLRSKRIFDYCESQEFNKIIVLGSQAEYGNYEGRVDENQALQPNTYYGIYKQKTLEYLQTKSHKMDWYWLRLFTIFGRSTGNKWFIDEVKSKLQNNEKLMVSLCEQKYDYMHIDDLLHALKLVVQVAHNESGIYNVSSNTSITLKAIIEKIKQLYTSKSEIAYGTLPYRENQVMHQEGNATKFNNLFNFTPLLNWENMNRELL